MAITYENVIEQLQCYPTLGQNANVVFSIYWRINATDGTHRATSYGSVGLDTENIVDFTAFNSLTKDKVWEWVAAKISVGDIEQQLDRQIQELVTPTRTTPALPWA